MYILVIHDFDRPEQNRLILNSLDILLLLKRIDTLPIGLRYIIYSDKNCFANIISGIRR